MKFLEEKTGINLHYLWCETFSNDTKSMRSKILKKDKLDIIKQKTSASRYHQESEKITYRSRENVCKILLIKDLYLKYIKNSYNSMIKRQITQLKMVK